MHVLTCEERSLHYKGLMTALVGNEGNKMSVGTNLKSGVIILVFVVGMVSIAAGRTIYVDDDGPADFNTIQAAIDDSNDGDTVIVADGIYTGEGNRDIDFRKYSHGLPPGPTRAITVRSANGPGNCIIDCNGTENDPHGGFRFENGEDSNSVIMGFAIINGYARCESYAPPFAVCEYLGGAIYCWRSSPTISNCIISGNTAGTGYGGGISCFVGNPTVSNCTFIGNSAKAGGGIDCWASSPTVTNCILWGNSDSGGTDESAQIDGTTVVVNYCCIQGLTGGLGGIGSIGDDPCFVDPCNGDYHLKSEEGRWEPNSESWVQDDVTSHCVDAGNPGCPVGDEPAPNGNRRNMGAYGGTTEASKSPANWRSIGDMTNDWILDSNDLKVFVGYWLERGDCIPSDLDRNQLVDFNDFALFSGSWPEVEVNPDCLLTTAPEYPLWVTLGKPPCWCYPRQCHGDADGRCFMGRCVTLSDLTMFSSGYHICSIDYYDIFANCPCIDFNHDGRVDYIDESIIIYWFNRRDVPADCEGILYPLGQLHQIIENWLEDNNP